MNLKSAYSLNVNRATKEELQLAIQELKRAYAVRSNAFKRHGETTELMKTVQERIDTNPSLYDKKVGQLSINEAREVFQTYRDYSARRTYDPISGKFTGYRETVTRTRKGYLEYQRKVGEDVLGYEKYHKLSESDRKDIWDIIDKVREMDKSLFLNSKISPESRYQSGTNIKQVMEFIKGGITDPVLLLEKLQEQVNTETFVGDIPFDF